MMGRGRNPRARPREARSPLELQAASRQALRDAVRVYAAHRGGAGEYVDTTPVQLRDGTTVVALIRIDLVPDASVDPTVPGQEA